MRHRVSNTRLRSGLPAKSALAAGDQQELEDEDMIVGRKLPVHSIGERLDLDLVFES